jgi:hypothetical protein
MSIEERIQKLYLGVGRVIDTDEARQILNESGANLTIPAPSSVKGDTDRYGQEIGQGGDIAPTQTNSEPE